MAAVSFAQPVGVIAVSTNYGLNWSTTNNAPQNRYWTSIACSADGIKMVASAWKGPYQAATLFTSTDSGTTWSSDNDAPTNDWNSVAASADGTRLLAVSGDWYAFDLIYVSTNSGRNWTAADAPGSDWVAAACSADGGKMYAAVGRHDITGPIYRAQTVVAPKLNIVSAGNRAVVSWTVPSTNFVLQLGTNLVAPGWVNVTNVPTVTNLQAQVVVSATNRNGFFRLKRQ
jgi:hypothetical protein